MLKAIGARLFGGSCFLCRGQAQALLCARCDADLPRLREALCPRCALPSPAAAVCGRCLAHPPAFDATRAALAYRFPADVMVQALKFRGELALATLLGRLLLDAAGAAEPVDCLVPVPLSSARLRERGFNQALEIARVISDAAGIRLAGELCERALDTPAQVGLPLAERARNMKGAFRCPRVLVGTRIAVVDDVMTSGSTLEEVARALKSAGAARVVNWVAARTLAPGVA
jgi:ComF family protein